jgi:integrase/recombinase XerC/integrase/recombinase XerD
MSEVELTKLISHFALNNRSEGKSPRTESWYTEMLSDYTRWLRLTGMRETLSGLDVTSAREFILYQQGKGLSPYTIQGHVRALKAFSSWLFAEGYTPDSVLAGLKLPKVPTMMIEPLTQAEIEKLLSMQNPLTAIGCRNIAILVVLLNTGLRVSELTGLRLEDAHIDEGYFKVMGKGAKQRIVPTGIVTQKVLWRYVYHFRPEPNNGDPGNLFLALDGTNLSTNAVKLIIKRWSKKAGVPRLHAHLCRHTYATNFLLYECGDVFRLKQNLGHSSLEMVNRYVHYASAQASVLSRSASPLDKLNIKHLRGSKVDKILKRKGESPGS